MNREIPAGTSPVQERRPTWQDVADNMKDWHPALQERIMPWLEREGIPIPAATAIEHRAAELASTSEGITSEHHQAHVEMGRAVDPDIDQREPHEQDLIGEIMELGDEAASEGRRSRFFGRLPAAAADKAVEKLFKNKPEKSEGPEDPIESLIGFGQYLSSTEGPLNQKSYSLLEDRIKVERNKAIMSLSFMNANNPADKARALGDIDTLARLHEAFAGVRFTTDKKNDRARSALDFTGALIGSELAVQAMAALSAEAKQNGRPSVPLRLVVSAAINKPDLSTPSRSAIYRLGREMSGDDPVAWLDDQNLDPSLRKVFETSYDPMAIAITLGETEIPGETGSQRLERISRMENSVLMDKLHLPPELMPDVKISLAHLTGDFNPDNIRRHFTKLRLIAERTPDPERALKLYRTFGIANFDRYTSAQLERMYKLAIGEPETIASLQQVPDLQLAITDRITDHNNALEFVAEALDAVADHGPLLVAETSHPAGYYRVMSCLKKMGIAPTTVIIGAHGHPGSFSLGGNFVGFAADTEKELPRHAYDISKSQIGRLVDDYMRPGSNGDKNAVFISCSLAMPGQGRETSVVEKVAEMTDAVAWGGDKPLNVAYEKDSPEDTATLRLIEIDDAQAKPMPIHRFRRTDGGMVHEKLKTIDLAKGQKSRVA